MKRLMITMLAGFLTFAFLGTALAESAFYPQGSITVPGIFYSYTRSNSYVKPSLILTNITDKAVQCKVRIYDHDGTDRTYLGRVNTGGTSWTVISNGSGDFKIPAHSTRWFNMNYNPIVFYFLGYATVEWSSTDTMARKALVGSLFTTRVTPASITDDIENINNGQPF